MKYALLFIFFLLPVCLIGQAPHWVQFTDKAGVKFNPENHFSPKALERRARHGISPYIKSDFPVKTSYIKNVGALADSTGFASRWFNMLETFATKEQLARISKLPFVKNIIPITLQLNLAGHKHTSANEPPGNEEIQLIHKQTNHLEGYLFHQKGLSGKNVRIAIFDGGFPGVKSHPYLEHINKENRIIKTWDFHKNTPAVFDFNNHGTAVLSCIAGKHDTLSLGLAPDASFLLARTEIRTEPFAEEKNWLAAAEWADKNGADIINSSLGYTSHRYFPEEMNGKQSLVAKAANLAAAKGMLVVNAMGNSAGNKFWKILGTPADADSVLSVAGIHPRTGYHTSFSSFGPTADMRQKPNVTAIAHVMAASPEEGLHLTQGTSFSSPLVAGFAACVLQNQPQLKVMELFRAIEQSASLHPYFDYAHGYGVPQASFFLNDTILKQDTTFRIVKRKDKLQIKVNKAFLNPVDSSRDYLYYHIQKQNGTLKKYALIKAEKTNAYTLPAKALKTGYILKVHFKGYTATYQP